MAALRSWCPLRCPLFPQGLEGLEPPGASITLGASSASRRLAALAAAPGVAQGPRVPPRPSAHHVPPLITAERLVVSCLTVSLRAGAFH